MTAITLLKLCSLGGLVILLSLLAISCDATSPALTPAPTPTVPSEPPAPADSPTPTPTPTSTVPSEPSAPAGSPEPTLEPTSEAPQREPTPEPEMSGLITNIQVRSGKTYQKDVLNTGAQVYTDRDYIFGYIPPMLKGQEFIRTANDDETATSDNFLTFTLASDAIVYVLYDMRSITLPEWLDNGGWEQTGDFVVTNDIIRRVYQKEFPAGEITLGSNSQPPTESSNSNYNVVARPADDIPPKHTASAGGSDGVEFAVTHVVYSESMIAEYTEGGQLAEYVLPYDSFMLVSGNNSGEIDTELLNSWAEALSARHPTATMYAATSGINNIRKGAPGLDTNLFAGLMMVYEPDQDNAPEFTWDMSETRRIWEKAANIIDNHGLAPWGKPSGRSLPPAGTYFGDWDYGVLAAIMNGVNVQTQGRCRQGEFHRALPYLIQQYRDVQATSNLFVQVTVSPNLINYADPEDAILCAQAGWAYPEVDGVTLWSGSGSVEEAEEFLQLRDHLFLPENVEVAAVVPTPTMTPAPDPTNASTPTPEPALDPTPAPEPTAIPTGTTVGGGGEGQFREPRGVAASSESNKVYVADTGNHRVQVFSSAGLFMHQWGSQGDGPGQFDEPMDIAVNPDSGNVYVADTGNHRVQVFNSSGQFLYQWGSQGDGPGQFDEPMGIAVNQRSGKVYVADTGNDRVQIFNSAGVFFFQWGSEGRDEGQFRGPSGITVDPETGRIYVADTGNNRIQILYESGAYDARWGRRGDVPGRFKSPSKIEFNPLNNYLYVTDTGNHRVQVFDLGGGFVFEWRIDGDAGEIELSEITGIGINPENGKVYLTDSANHLVQVFGQGGTFTSEWGN